MKYETELQKQKLRNDFIEENKQVWLKKNKDSKETSIK